MKSEKITKEHARSLILRAHKIDGSLKSAKKTLEHLGYVQIDTISVIERAHHHVFWSHNHNYRPSDLDRLIKKRNAFEYWAHAAAYLPMKDYRFSLYKKDPKKWRFGDWSTNNKKLMNAVLKRIKEEGPLRSKDFENKRKGSTGWWEWKPAKRALERLFLEGRLEISHREGFQKVFDLPERVIPGYGQMKQPSEVEYIHYLIERTLRNTALTTIDEIAHLCKKPFKDAVKRELTHLIEDGKVVKVQVEGLENSSYYSTLKHLKAKKTINLELNILSPFDNLTIQRKRLKDFFDFDYQIECYVPAPKRKFGYFTLPIVKGDKFVGRADCKADRSSKKLVVNGLFCEKGVKKAELKKNLKPVLENFMEFNGCSILKNV